MSKEKQEQDNLVDFSWDDSQDSFFGMSTLTGEPVVDKTEETKTEIKEEEKVEQTKAPKKKETEVVEEEKLSDDDFDFGAPVEVEKEEEEVETTKTNSQVSVYDDLVQDLKENEIFRHIELEEGESLDSERFTELMQEEYEAEVTSRIENWAKQDLDEDAQAFIKFKRSGGSTAEFFETYSRESDLPRGDISDEQYQDKLIRYQLKEEGWDSDEIEDRLQYLEGAGRKRKFAEKYDAKIKATIEEQRQAFQKEQEERVKANKNREREYNESVKSALEEAKEIGGAKVSEAEKTKLFNFLTKKSHKVNEDITITGFQQKLGEVFKDPQKTLLLAKIIESDFELTSIKKKAVTENNRKIKSRLEQRSSIKSSGPGSSSQSLADLFQFD